VNPLSGELRSMVEDWLRGTQQQPLEDWLRNPSNYIQEVGIHVVLEPVAGKPILLFVGVTDFNSIADWRDNTYMGRITFKKDVWPYLLEDAVFQIEFTPRNPTTGLPDVDAFAGFRFGF
jgi:hypothetical protein